MLEIAGTCMVIMFFLGVALPVPGPVVLVIAFVVPVMIVAMFAAAGPVADQFGLVVVVALIAAVLSEFAAAAGLLARVMSGRAQRHGQD